MNTHVYRLSRLRCCLRGHAWSIPAMSDRGALMVCTRTACRGREDATMWLSGGAR